MQEVIIYRNPLEARMWQALDNVGLFPIIVGVAVFFAVFLALNHILTRGRTYGQPAWKTNTALFLGAAAGFATIWKMV